MRKLDTGVFLITVLLGSGAYGAEQPGAITCNQMGREIALRAAEELTVPLDASVRMELAAIAESTCVSYLPGTPDEAAAGLTAPVDTASAKSADGDSERTLFDLEFIEPEDRVRRPGLKRR